MGFTTPDLPPVDPAEFLRLPYRERTQLLARHWVDHGFGTPKVATVVYIVKLLVCFVGGGAVVATLTSGLDTLKPGLWWDDPIVWQKAVLWTVLLESIGVAGSWGPLAGHFKPMTGGIRYWARPRTIRMPPWPDRVPFTAGDERRPVDVALYLALLAALVVALLAPARAGLVAPAALVPILVLLGLIGLRDKVVFIAARSEQYIPALVFFALYPFVDMIVAAKLLIVTVWVGAAFSKLGRHFASVIPPMVSNTPWVFVRAVKRLHYRAYPDDLRPAPRAVALAHGAGTLVEMGTPFLLLFSQSHALTVAGVVLMLGFHTFIISTFPLAVPLEWNALFMYVCAFLFLGFPNQAGYGPGDMDPVLLVVTLAGLLAFPVLGNLRPDLVSFLPAMRQYAGNWATAMWALAPGCEARLNEHLVKAAPMQKDQLAELFDPLTAEVIVAQPLAWRAMHSQGRGLNSVMINQLGPDIDAYTLREGEFFANAILGFNFGDGHLHDHRFVAAVQKRCRFAPGELIVVWAESEPLGKGRQRYWVMDAAVGFVERGSWAVRDAIREQPWLPDGPIPTQVDWRLADYERVRHARAEVPA